MIKICELLAVEFIKPEAYAELFEVTFSNMLFMDKFCIYNPTNPPNMVARFITLMLQLVAFIVVVF